MVRRQNEALTSKLVLRIRMCSVAEGEWRAAQNPARQIDVEDTVCFMLLGFGARLRGEEVPLVNLEGLLMFWMETREEEDRYMMITLQGRFKGEVDQRWHIVPICGPALAHCAHLRRHTVGYSFQALDEKNNVSAGPVAGQVQRLAV